MNILKILTTLGGNKTAPVQETKPTNNVEILFHREANSVAEHGVLIVDNVGLGLKNFPIRFAFKDMAKIPELSRATFNMICDKAEDKGFNVISLRSYGQMRWIAEAMPPRKLKEMLTSAGTVPQRATPKTLSA